MKYIIKIFLIYIIFCSCKKNDTIVNVKTISPKVSTKNNIKDNNFPNFDTKKFSYLFEYKEEESYQLIGINIIDKKTINFHLVTETLPCDTEYWGIAENEYWNGDGEVDEDNNESYFADEYFKEEKEYIVGIRLAEDLSKLKIKFTQKDSLDTDCLPIVKKTMKRIK
ncbi:MAG: hypothetical protein O9282_00925 [Flavobacterium sp.]|jgi:hypothetical protein|uniref:hypothetical protein n=1 Tax=Flavobacterium sp. TaxID=239 RepID=UPI0022C5FA53|nr:hypothetical protein [Flavobacterium sp.]MCZ8329852.1 hypothetical protein [Flavobacterium sp.]